MTRFYNNPWEESSFIISRALEATRGARQRRKMGLKKNRK
jgi:hypothetical protein